MLLVHDSASGQFVAGSQAFSPSFTVSESPVIMFHREEIHSLIYSIKIVTEQSPGSRGGAGRRGRSPEEPMGSALDDISVAGRGDSRVHPSARCRATGRHMILRPCGGGVPHPSCVDGQVSERQLWKEYRVTGHDRADLQTFPGRRDWKAAQRGSHGENQPSLAGRPRLSSPRASSASGANIYSPQ